MRCYLFILTTFLTVTTLFGQTNSDQVLAFKAEKTRILFLLDASGSMTEDWNGTTKYEAATNVLINVMDSLSKKSRNVEFGVRVFGHQVPRALKDCNDTYLEIPFGNNSVSSIAEKLKSFKPQGQTPIAHSLYLAAQDFPKNYTGSSTNVVILITDGLENCDGDPCAAARLLEKRRVAIKPFIIGIALDLPTAEKLSCIGRYFNANTASSFANIMNALIDQAMRPTTVQVNLLDDNNEPTVSNVEFTLYDHFTGAIRYNFVHTFNDEGNPDTLLLDPMGIYDIQVHSIPSISKKIIELVPGQHNIIPVKVPHGLLTVNNTNQRHKGALPKTIVRESNSKKILYVQEMDDPRDYLSGDFDIDVLTLPRVEHKFLHVKAHGKRAVDIEEPGILSLVSSKEAIASIYKVEGEILTRIFEYKSIEDKSSLKLQPGNYLIVDKPLFAKTSEFTDQQFFEIISGKTTYVRF